MKPAIFNIEMFFDIGNSLLISLLDYDGLNPYSRLIKKKEDSLSDCVDKLRKDFKKSEEKPSIGEIKKKLGVGKSKKTGKSKLDEIECVVLDKKGLSEKFEELKILE